MISQLNDPVQEAPRRPGRQRSEKSHEAVLAAAERLLLTVGYGKVTMEGLARESGVAKPTLYRWWPGKAAIYQEIYMREAGKFLGVTDTGSVEKDLSLILRGMCRVLSDEVQGRAMAGMMAEAQLEHEHLGEFQAWLFRLRELGLMQAVQRGIARGEIRSALRPETGSDLLIGPVIYRLILEHEPVNEAFADLILDQFLRAWGSRKDAG